MSEKFSSDISSGRRVDEISEVQGKRKIQLEAHTKDKGRFGWLILLFIYPLLVVFFEQAVPENQPMSHLLTLVLIFVLLVMLFMTAIQFIYVLSFDHIRLAFIRDNQRLVDANIKPIEIDLQNTEQYFSVNIVQFSFIFSTFFVVFLWFAFPDNPHLEPLSLLYTFGTATFGYFRAMLNVRTPIDSNLSE